MSCIQVCFSSIVDVGVVLQKTKKPISTMIQCGATNFLQGPGKPENLSLYTIK